MEKNKQIWRIDFLIKFYLYFLILLLPVTGKSAKLTCREHYLSGNFKSGIYSLSMHPSLPEFRVFCQFPNFGSPPTHLSINTIIRNGLEMSWHQIGAEKQTIQYQYFKIKNNL